MRWGCSPITPPFPPPMLEGLTNGFRISFNRRHPLCSSVRILSTKNPDVITSYLKREIQLGRMSRHSVYYLYEQIILIEKH